METFFTGDTHFGHRAILRHQPSTRAFSSIEEHDEEIISRWNARVRPRDQVYHLGDFALGNREHWWRIRQRLNGRIVLIRGNHDDMINGEMAASFERVERLLEVRIPGLHDHRVTLCHYPLRSWRSSWHGTVHLHGHSHNAQPIADRRAAPDDGAEHWRRRVDVGVDAWGLAPAHVDEVKAALEAAR